MLKAIGETIPDDDFNATQLWAHAGLHQVLKAALIAADVDNTRDLGKLLPRLEAGAGGLRLVCVDPSHRLGRRYQLRLCDFHSREVAPG